MKKMTTDSMPAGAEAALLALEDRRAAQTGVQAGQYPANPPARILMVDDESSQCRINCAKLAASGYEVDSAFDGAAGWDALQSKQYDLVVTDNSMPKVTGVEMVAILRGKNMTLPVILATGVAPTEELKRHPELKINAILLKPYTIEELLAAVASILRPAGATQPEKAPSPEDESQP